MPRRPDVPKVLIIGSGPIVIGQACEFDYSGTQACKALRRLGYEIVLVNSNPATIMTDPVMADETYIEPLNLETLTEIIATSKPDALLPNLGGQSGLNLSSELHRAGVLAEVRREDHRRGPRRHRARRGPSGFQGDHDPLGIDMPRSEICYTVDEAAVVAAELGYPVVIRPAYTMGGTGGGIVYNREELQVIVARGIRASLVGQVLVEESVLGWEELELEVVRDAKNQMITVCFIENVDAMGVHTGDSFCTAPMLTIAPALQETLQNYSYCDRGGHRGDRRHQHPVRPRPPDRPRGGHRDQPAHLALLRAGLQGHRLPHRLGQLPAGRRSHHGRDPLLAGRDAGEVHALRRLRGGEVRPLGLREVPRRRRQAGHADAAVGEVMSIGKNYKESLQKAIRSLETGRHGLGFAKDFNARSLDELLAALSEPTSERQFIMYEALRKGATIEALCRSHLHQGLVHRADAGAGGARGVDPPLSAPGGSARGDTADADPASRSRVRPPTRAPRRSADAGQEGRLRRRLPGQAARRARGPTSASSAGRWAWSTATSRCR